MTTNIIKGQETPVVQGWMPEGHGIRGVRPTPTVVYGCRSAQPVVFVMAFQPLRDDTEPRVSRITCDADRVGIASTTSRSVEVTLPPE